MGLAPGPENQIEVVGFCELGQSTNIQAHDRLESLLLRSTAERPYNGRWGRPEAAPDGGVLGVAQPLAHPGGFCSELLIDRGHDGVSSYACS